MKDLICVSRWPYYLNGFNLTEHLKSHKKDLDLDGALDYGWSAKEPLDYIKSDNVETYTVLIGKLGLRR